MGRVTISAPAVRRDVAFALVHFTVGFVSVLAVVSVLRITRYRLTGAYLGGIWALVPDAHHLLDGPIGRRVAALHGTPRADVFFLHHALDQPVFRAHNVELVFLSLVALGLAFAGYDRLFGDDRAALRAVRASEESNERS